MVMTVSKEENLQFLGTKLGDQVLATKDPGNTMHNTSSLRARGKEVC